MEYSFYPGMDAPMFLGMVAWRDEFVPDVYSGLHKRFERNLEDENNGKRIV